ncbi:DUF3102 domain-containing protein [Desulfitobacterium hafniense]|uniref:DUF3102 domain-containing protein n=1 Tax=Desulfitobacterium hafniense TaxID=49338 RepID=UPI00036E7EE2|nr:DUF3102 domain-containing protein [Desulfitobacterium hafniense]
MNDELTARTPVVIAAEINSIKDHTRNMILQGSIEIGLRLCEAKEMLPHGEWGKWLEKSVEYSHDTAANLMKIYREYGNSNFESIRNLPYTKAVALLGIPAAEREQFAQENDALNTTVRKLQQAIEEKKKAKEELAAAEAKARKLAEDYEKLEKSNRENHDIAERLKRELEEAKASGSVEDIERLTEQLAKTDSELSIAQKKIKDLEREIRETPVEVTTAVAEKIPEDVEKELMELRAKTKSYENAAKEGTQSEKAKLKFSAYFETLVKGFQDILNTLSEIDEEEQTKYKGAVSTLIEKMSEKVSRDKPHQDSWVSVNEKLPEAYTMVLIWDGDNIFRAEYVNGEWHGIPDNTGFFPDSITHWQTLPEGPKEEVSS